ncbi:kelch-like protein 2 isoform X2 [Acyrthosiphon pisum]|nr:kelch-like protein 2 isoform X2 [Acyrthosiphon pisum]|eukprot:XP_016658544.1 PREDICTED: kelch-like protein 2 isoform X2 [Acyrthosiphon pisum]
MFTSFEESKKELIHIKELDSTTFQSLIDYIYTGEIVITGENIHVLLPAANFLQLDFVVGGCVEFLQKQIVSSNCLGIKAFAGLYNCVELLTNSEAYIKKHFVEVIKYDEFLSLSSEEVIKLISCNDLTAPFEEKVYECVIDWIKYELECRKDFLPDLMEHVRLPLASKQYILENVVDEPLLKHSPKCKDYIFEVLHFYVLKSVQPFTILQNIRSKTRQPSGLQKVVLVFSWCKSSNRCNTYWYDPATNIWMIGPQISKCRETAGFNVIKDQFVIAVGGINNSSSQSVEILNLSSQSPCWEPIVDMLISRKDLGVGVLDGCIYAVGGSDGTSVLNNAEVFCIQEWQMISSMTSKRSRFGVGVLNNLLYAVGGFDGISRLKSVECYDPRLNKWAPVAEMSVCRSGVSVEVLDGVMYAIGGTTGSIIHKSCEAYRPNAGVWTSIADMHLCRVFAGVFAFNGLLYVMGGIHGCCTLDSVEIYNPNTNTWSIKTFSTSFSQIYGAVVVHSPRIF